MVRVTELWSSNASVPVLDWESDMEPELIELVANLATILMLIVAIATLFVSTRQK
jgi:hypothetical protein